MSDGVALYVDPSDMPHCAVCNRLVDELIASKKQAMKWICSKCRHKREERHAGVACPACGSQWEIASQCCHAAMTEGENTGYPLCSECFEPVLSRVRTRRYFVEELMRHGALVSWIGIFTPDGDPIPYSPDVARELLYSMPDAEFATLLRAAGMEALALRFEAREHLERMAVLCGSTDASSSGASTRGCSTPVAGLAPSCTTRGCSRSSSSTGSSSRRCTGWNGSKCGAPPHGSVEEKPTRTPAQRRKEATMTKPLTKEEKEKRAAERAKAKGAAKPKAPKAKKKPNAKSAKKESASKGKKQGKLASDVARRKEELDVSKLDATRAKKMLDSIHALERVVEKKQRLFDLASQNRRAAKAELEESQDALSQEINDQRFGPGPLFDPNAKPLAGAPASMPPAGPKGDGEDDADDDEAA